MPSCASCTRQHDVCTRCGRPVAWDGVTKLIHEPHSLAWHGCAASGRDRCPHCGTPVEWVGRQAMNRDTRGGRHCCDYLFGQPITDGLSWGEREWEAQMTQATAELMPEEAAPMPELPAAPTPMTLKVLGE